MILRMKLIALIALLAVALMVGTAAFAQEGSLESFPVTLEELTADPTPYYGQMVILDGLIEDFVNVNTIVLGEGVALDNDQILLINNTGQSFSPRLMLDTRIAVTGVVYPSIVDNTDPNAQPEGLVTEDPNFVASPTPGDPMAEATAGLNDMDIMEGDALTYFYNRNFPDTWNNFVIIEITDLNNISLSPTEEGQ